jgi:hypothetical protein
MPRTGALGLAASPWGMYGSPDPAAAYYQQYYQYYAQAGASAAPSAAFASSNSTGKESAAVSASASTQPAAADPYAQYGGYEAYCAQWNAYYASQGANKDPASSEGAKPAVEAAKPIDSAVPAVSEADGTAAFLAAASSTQSTSSDIEE